MIKNYFNLNRGLNIKKAICLLFVFFIFIQISHGQCATPVLGCPNTDLSNFGTASNNNAATIEYDNFVSSFHTTVVRTSNGSFQVWGEKIANNGTSNQLTPLTVNVANFPALTTATPLKAGLGSFSSNTVQGILLATDGLYAWATEGSVLDESITSSAAFQKLTIDGNTNGLPAGVSPGDVKMLFATYKTLAITTCSGDVWVISQSLNMRGNGTGATSATKWYRVTTSANGNPFLTDVVACRGSYEGLMALRSDGTVYVWGKNVYLGNNSAVIADQTTAVQMTIPSGITPKMIGSSGNGTSRSYYILATDGNLYGVGENSNRELGDWTVTDRLSWVQPRYTSAAGPVMNNIKWFSSQEHDSQYGSVNVINDSKNIYAFGNNNGSLLGTTNNPSDPIMPNGLSPTDDILAVETGGHTSMIVKNCQTKFGYVGHRISGSMGDGNSTSATEKSYTFATANVQICGAESNPAIQPISTGGGPNSKYCVDDPVLLNPTPTGGTLSILSGPGTLSGNTLSFTGVGTVSVQYSVTTACGGTSVTTRNFDAALCPVDLQVTKVVDNTNASVGSNSVFTITATNNGPYKATGVVINDALPSGYTFVSAVPSAGTWTAPDWTIGNLANAASATLTVTATVNPTGSYANTATISGNNPETGTTNNSATATPIIQTNLSVTKSVDKTTPNVGDTVKFTITASNSGPSAATGVVVTDSLPSGYTFVSATPSAGTWLAPDWTVGSLANGVSETLIITATVNATGSYINTATITGVQNDPTPVNNSGSVTPVVNHAPVANDDDRTAFPLTEDGADGSVAILVNDTDSDGNPTAPVNGANQFTVDLDPLTAGIQTTFSDAKGSWTLNSTAGIVTFNPANNYNGTAKITYTLCDALGLCDSADITFLVNAVNDNPAAVDDSYKVSEDSSVILNPLNSDTDVDGDTLTITSINGITLTGGVQEITVPNGKVNISATGVMTFTPDANFNSATAIHFPYEISDGKGGTATANQVITVTSVNDNPVAVDDSYTVSEDSSVILNPLNSDTDVDGDTLTITSINGMALTGGVQEITVPNGKVNISASGLITFTPDANFNSATAIQFPYEISDGNGGTATANQIITVTAVNDNPVAVDDSYTVSEDSSVILNPLNSDTDVDGDTLTITSINGIILIGGLQEITVPNGKVNVSATGVITFTPDANFNSATAIQFPYEISDGNGGTATANQIITVTAVNDNPVAVDDTYTVAEDTSVTLNPLHSDTDVDGDTLTITSINGIVLTGGVQEITVPNGKVNISATGVITFTPDANFNSATAIQFPYEISDGKGGTTTANQIITVTAVNDNPVAVDDSYTVSEDSSVILSPLNSDTDVDGDTLTITSINGITLTGGVQEITVPNGKVNISATGVITFTPGANFNSATAIQFPYQISDGKVGTATANQIIMVTAVNDAPIASADSNNSVSSNAGETPINALSATDIDGTITNYTIITLPTGGILKVNGTIVTAGQVLTPSEAAQLTYEPNGAFTGNDTFTFTATDNLGAVSTSAVITIPVVNNAPVANDQTNSVIPSKAGATVIDALTASDSDGTIVNYIVLTLPANGILALNGIPVVANKVLTPAEAAILTYDPSGAFAGNDTFTFTATDNNGSIDATPAILTIPVVKSQLNAVKDEAGSVVGINEVVKVINILNNDTLDNNPIVVTDVTIKTVTPDPKGILTLNPDGTADLAPNAPAGTYTLTYEICEAANNSNCSSATVSVTVVAPEITVTATSFCSDNAAYVTYNVAADNFTPKGLVTINWIDSANNIVATQTNMPINGTVLWPGTILNANNKPTDWPGWVLVNGQWTEGNDGFELTRPAVTMQFSLNPTKSVSVNYPSALSGCSARPQFGIEAGNDNDNVIADGINGSLEVVNVLDNDKLNGVPVNPADVTIKGQNFPTGITLNADGTIDVAPGTPGGNYDLTYQICEKANASNCTTATVHIFVEVPAISLIMKASLNDTNGNGTAEAGETITYTFTVKNTGNTALQNITIADLLPGVVINGGPVNLAVGERDTMTFTGKYVLTQADIIVGLVSNQATVSGFTQKGVSTSDISDAENIDGDTPTVIELKDGCSIKIFNAVSLNGDEKNTRFYIRGIECYPDNTVQVYNRWGVLVFERDHYNNNDIVFKGFSEGRTTVKESNGLPEGTYYYILRYKDNQSKPQQEAGYLYLTR